MKFVYNKKKWLETKNKKKHEKYGGGVQSTLSVHKINYNIEHRQEKLHPYLIKAINMLHFRYSGIKDRMQPSIDEVNNCNFEFVRVCKVNNIDTNQKTSTKKQNGTEQ